MPKGFLREIDSLWKPSGGEPHTLRLIGSTALLLQSNYVRGTKDGDVLQSEEIEGKVSAQLLAIAGKQTDFHRRSKMYLDIVPRGLLFLPQKPIFHTPQDIPLKNFIVEVLDIHDVVVSKLQPFRSQDIDDIQAMAKRDKIVPAKLVERFTRAADWFSLDARADDLPRYLKNLNKVERDILGVAATQMDFE